MENKISIIIPTFNRAPLISETIDSIVNQTYVNWECIIIDDGSTDMTELVIQQYSKDDKRIKYYKRPDYLKKGANSSRNYGFSLASGDFVKFFDSDDIMRNDFLELQLKQLQKDENLDFCACQWKYFYEDGRVFKNEVKLETTKLPIYSFFFEGHVFATPAPLWRKKFLENKELFDINIMYSDESDFHCRMLLETDNYKILPDFLFSVRRGHSSLESQSNSLASQLSVHDYFEKIYKIILSKNINTIEAKKVEEYLVFRVFRQKYIIFSKQDSFKHRLNYIYILRNINAYFLTLNFIDSVKVSIGCLLSLSFKRGYNLLSLKKFDYKY